MSGKGDYDGAEPLYHRALAGGEKVLGSEEAITLWSVNNLANLLNATNRRAEAVELLRKHAAKSPAALAGVRYSLACYECLSGNHEEAQRLMAEEIAANPEKKEQALQDSDLEAIREFIRGL